MPVSQRLQRYLQNAIEVTTQAEIRCHDLVSRFGNTNRLTPAQQHELQAGLDDIQIARNNLQVALNQIETHLKPDLTGLEGLEQLLERSKAPTRRHHEG